VSFDLIGAISTNLCTFSCYPIVDVAVTAVHAAPAVGQTAVHGLMTVTFFPQVAFTSDVDVFDANGAGTLSMYTSSVIAQSNQSAGNICLINEEGTGVRNYNSILAYGVLTNAAYSGSVRGFCTESASIGSRLAQGCQVRLIGAGAGTAIAFNLDTGTDPSEYYYTGCTCFVDGFASEYVSYTSVNAIQKIWLNSVNKDLPKSGTGRSIITPYDERKSGFVAWGEVTGSNYWSVSGNTFTVVPSGVGVVRGSPVAWDAGQSITVLQGVNYIYMTSTGVIGRTSSGAGSLYASNIVLFQVLYDGTTTKVFKENHPYEFESAVSSAWHRLFGSLLEGLGAIISTLSAGNRTIQSAGADVLTDHGLDTTIPDSTAAAVSMTLIYRNGSGGSTIGSTVTQLPGQYNSGTNLVNTNDYVIWRILVGKDNLEGTAQYFAVADVNTYANLSAANAAITNGTVVAVPTDLNNCEVVMVGYVIINGDGTGAGTIESTISSRKTFGASFLGGSPSSTANLVSITDIAGPIVDTASTVQAALEEVNTNAAKKAASSTDNALTRFDGATGQLLQNGVITQDDSGNLASVGTVNSHAIPAGTDAFVTADATQTLTNKTLTQPTISNFTSANHDHSDVSKGGLVVAATATQQGAVSTSAQTFAGLKTFNNGIAADTIAEKTSGAGVTIDSAVVKDGAFRAASTDANRLPVGTTAQRSSAVTGDIRFNSSLNTFEVRNSGGWVPQTIGISTTLASGDNTVFTPADINIVGYEALLYTTTLSGESVSKCIVKLSTVSTIAVYSTGDDNCTVTVDAGTGALVVNSASAGAVIAKIDILYYY
jgi:hypothetical protein